MHRHKLIAMEDATEALLTFFPNLREAYARATGAGQGEIAGPYIVYEDVFFPYITTLLASTDTDARQGALDFVDLLVTSDDARVHDLVRVVILAPLTIDPSQLAEARRHLGPATKRTLRQLKHA